MFRGRLTIDWCKYEQSFIFKEKHFEKKKTSIEFGKGKGFYRSNTRVNLGKLDYFQEYPILLLTNSYFRRLVILQCHEDVHHMVYHGGSKEKEKKLWKTAVFRQLVFSTREP